MLRVLIIKLSAFGDIIHSLSVIDCFKEFSEKTGRKVKLDWLVEKKWSPILKGCPELNRVILTNTKEWRKSPFNGRTLLEISELWSNLRRDKYDLVIDINGLLRSALLARISRAKQRVGFSVDSDFCRERHSTCLLDKTISVAPGHVVDQTVRLLQKILDIEIPETILPYLHPDNSAANKARQILNQNGLTLKNFAIIAAGGGWETKLLDEKLIAGLCDCVYKHGIEPVLSWSGTNEKTRAERISAFAEGRVKDLGDLPIDVFIEILRMSRIVIGPDTGTIHAASAVKTPTVSYYVPSSAEYSGPRRSTDRLVQISPHCGPCFKRRCDESLCNNPDIQQVLDEINDQLKNGKEQFGAEKMPWQNNDDTEKLKRSP